MSLSGILRFLRARQSLVMQLLFVTLAFALMVVATGIFVNNMMIRYLERDAKNILTQTQISIMSELREPETIMLIVVQNVRDIINNGGGPEDIRKYFDTISVELWARDQGFRFDGIHAYFYDFDGSDVYIPVGGWTPTWEDATQRPWYTAAIEADVGVGASRIYFSPRSEQYQITFASRIFDDAGHPLGVIALNVPITNLTEFICNTRLTEGGYGMLATDLLDVISHPMSDFIGGNLRELNPITNHMADMFELWETSASAVEWTNYQGLDSILFGVRIENGWYLGVVTPRDEYFQNLTDLLWLLGVLGFILTAVTWLILIRIDISRIKADKAILEQSTQLALMEERHKAEEHSQLMFDATPLVSNLWTKDMKLIKTNNETLRLFGVSSKQDYLEKFHKFSPDYQPDGQLSSEKRIQNFRKAFEEGFNRYEWVNQTEDGEQIPGEITVVRIKHEDDYVCASFFRDLREMKAAIAEIEKGAQAKNALSSLEKILNGLDAMIYVTDPKNGEILFINDEMRRQFNITGNGVGLICYKVLQKGKTKRCEFCPCIKLDKDPFTPIIWEEHNSLTGRIYRNVDTYIPWPDGRFVHMQHCIDITELVAAKEAAEQSNQSKGIFLAQMSHEIRTPMNAILGISEIQLRDLNLSPDAEDGYRKIYESGNLLLNIINDILDFSKIDAGKLELTHDMYDIPSLISDTVQINLLRYESKPIDFKLSVDESTPLELIGDELRIRQVLNNLLSNAYKYTDSGEVELSVTSEPGKDDETVTLVFRVRDTGQGMSKEQVEKLFEEYSRFNMETNRGISGTGLGMPITKRLLDMMDGEILVESELDKGTVFTIRLPQKLHSSAVCGPDTAKSLRNFSFRKATISKRAQFIHEYMPYGRVLVVDDVESNLYVAKGMMMPYGMHIELAKSGFEAIDKIKAMDAFDIVFMDHMMPKMDGIKTTKLIREMGYTGTITALTANAVVGQSEMFLANGFDGFLAKPIDSRELDHVLTSLIRDKRSPEEVEAARREQREQGPSHRAAPQKNDRAEIEKYFIIDAKNSIDVVEGVMAKGHPDDDDMQAYITAVHGVKTALANIGESELSRLALKLEKAGNARNFNLIADNTPILMNELKAIVERLQPAIPSEEDDAPDVSADDMVFLLEKLLDIKTAGERFDKRAAKTALTDLKQKTWSRAVNEILEEISTNLLQGEFKKVAAVAEKAEEELR